MLQSRRPIRSGFSMLELLIVIGILGLLAALLLPSVNRIRDQAKQSHCMSNLSQLGLAFQVYAMNSEDYIPIGYADGQPWTGYFICESAKYYPLMGCLYRSGLLNDAPRTFYCPSQIDPRWQFDTPANPWPPPNPTGSHTRAGYTARPTLDWRFGVPTTPMRRLANMSSKAVLADIVGIPQSAPDYTDVHHRSLNVLFGDRSVRAVDRSAYEADQHLIEAYSASSSYPTTLYLDESNPSSQALWNAFDRR